MHIIFVLVNIIVIHISLYYSLEPTLLQSEEMTKHRCLGGVRDEDDDNDEADEEDDDDKSQDSILETTVIRRFEDVLHMAQQLKSLGYEAQKAGESVEDLYRRKGECKNETNEGEKEEEHDVEEVVATACDNEDEDENDNDGEYFKDAEDEDEEEEVVEEQEATKSTHKLGLSDWKHDIATTGIWMAVGIVALILFLLVVWFLYMFCMWRRLVWHCRCGDTIPGLEPVETLSSNESHICYCTSEENKDSDNLHKSQTY